MALSACYTAKITTDKQRYLRVTLLGADKTKPTAMPVNIWSTEVPMRDTLPELPTELMRGRDRTTANVNSAQGNLAGITQGNVNITEKMVTLTLGDDLSFDLGKLPGQMYRSILKSICVGETFKASTTDRSGIKPIGVTGNLSFTGGNCPSFVYGTEVKYLFSKMMENRVAYGEGKTVSNVFIESASFNQLGIIIEIKTVYSDGTAPIVNRAFGCGGAIKQQSADEQNKFTFDYKIYSDGEEYDNFLVDGGINALETRILTGTVTTAATTSVTGTGTKFLTEVKIGDYLAVDTVTSTLKVASIESDTALTLVSAATVGSNKVGIVYSSDEVRALNVKYAVTNATVTSPTGAGVVGDLVMVKTPVGTGASTFGIYLCLNTAAAAGSWIALESSCVAGTIIFSTLKSAAVTLTTPSTEYAYHAVKAVTTKSTGNLALSTISAISSTSATFEPSSAGTTAFLVKDFDTASKSFVSYLG